MKLVRYVNPETASDDKESSAAAKKLKERNKELHQSFDDYMDEVHGIGKEVIDLQEELKTEMNMRSVKQLAKIKDKASRALDKAVNIAGKIKDNEEAYKKLVGKEIFEAKLETAFTGINHNFIVNQLRMTHAFSNVTYNDVDETTFEIVCRKKEKNTELPFELVLNLVKLCRRSKYEFSINAEPKYIKLMFTTQPF
jgi:hypothetical protein